MNKTKVKTYASDRVKCILDNSHVASGLTKDSFIKITPSGGGTSYTSALTARSSAVWTPAACTKSRL